ncbi:MAG: hypothetical protein RL417_1003 [Pseudomonadota bacterium]|jgi:hypothetical protein
MISSFFTVSEKVSVGVEVQWSRANYISLGGHNSGVKVPVASRRKLERIHHGTVVHSPKLRIEPIESLPATVEPHAVVMLRSSLFSAEDSWSHFPLPVELMPKGKRSRSVPEACQIASGVEVVRNEEHHLLLVALPPNSAIELPLFDIGPKVLLWLGKGIPALIHKGTVKSLKRSC